jgi:uracil-DNA glycosylase
MHLSCPGYVREPFATLAAEAPGDEVYPAKDFRTEWGPIFHRGRLDGTARVLVLGQDPATHENVTRRILVGEAGQRVQGLLARIGAGSDYVMVNTFLYSVYGQGGGNRHADDQLIAAYRNRWLDALLGPGSRVQAVITLGTLADRAYRDWARAGAATRTEPVPQQAKLRHPTFPESATAAGSTTLERATSQLLENWNQALPDLTDRLGGTLELYGNSWRDEDLTAIPAQDLPAGSPAWWRDLESWATRTGTDAQTRRATLTISIPAPARTWPPVG